MSEVMFYGNCFTEGKDLYTKAVIRFYCNLIYKLKLIKQNVIFFSFVFHIKIDIQGHYLMHEQMHTCQ